MQKNDKPIHIIADDRERKSEVIESLLLMKGITVQIKRLSIGDYSVHNRLVFERKTLKDFASSLIDGRLFNQMIRLANSKYRGILILEGIGKDLADRGVKREAMQGALVTVALILGIPVLRSKEPYETAKLIVYAARQIRSIVKGGFQRQGYQPKNKRSRQLYILQGLPGVGRERAMRLLDNFGSVEAVIIASSEELQSVDGIGENIADKIKWAVSERIRPYGILDDFPL
jgi:ERCC4-type nuclease